MRICLVTPFAWSQPHDVNEHVAGIAAALRDLGHTVTVVAPSTRAADLKAATADRTPVVTSADAVDLSKVELPPEVVAVVEGEVDPAAAPKRRPACGGHYRLDRR